MILLIKAASLASLSHPLPQFLLFLGDFLIKFIPIFPNAELGVVVHRYLDSVGASRLIFWRVKLIHVGMSQRLFDSQPPVRIEL